MVFSKKRISKKINIFKILSILLIAIFIVSIPFFVQKLIKITKIECKTQIGNCEQQFNLGSYFTIKKQIERQLDKDIKVNNYTIQYKIPSTVRIDINIKTPIYSIKDTALNYYLIDKNGLVLDIKDKSNLVTLKGNFSYKIGDMISDRDIKLLKIIEKVKWLYLVKEGEYVNNYLQIRLPEGANVYFPDDGDTDTLVGSLRLIFSRLNDGSEGIRMENVHEIDLRYKNTIIR